MTDPSGSSFEQLDLAAHRLPGVVAAGHVAGIEARLAQRDRGLATDVEAIDAVGHDRLLLRQLADPVVEPLGIAPHRAFHDVLRPRAVVTWPGVDDLHVLPRLEHCSHLFGTDRL